MPAEFVGIPQVRERALAVVAAVAVVLGACVDVEVRLIGPQRPSRPADCAVDVFAEGRPPYVTTDVASATVSCSGDRGKCVAALRKQACAVGADVIYGVGETRESGFSHISATFAARVR
jgi:hypothetical protein